MFVFSTINIKQNNTTVENYPYTFEEHQIFLITFLQYFKPIHLCQISVFNITPEDIMS